MATTRRSIRTAELVVAVLAAGRATRFGGGKLEALCAGKPLGRWAIDAVAEAGLAPGPLVTGPGGASYAPGWTPVVNPDPEAGLGSSLALAARWAIEQGGSSLLVLLADMPLVTPAYLQELAASRAPSATLYPDGHAGVPALLDRALLEQAATFTGDRGAGTLLRDALLLHPPVGMLADVDTPADLREVQRALTSHPSSSPRTRGPSRI